MSLLQNILRSGITPEQLKEIYGIDSKPHGQYPNLIQFKYNQIESPKDNPIVVESRGMILDRDDSWKIVAWPFNRFFNAGEGCASEIDWNTAKVQEKLDGSLCIVYHYDNLWHVATSGSPDATGNVNGYDFSFGDLFWNTWSQLGYKIENLDKQSTYMFELMTPFNKIVVQHKENSIVLLGSRKLDSYKEIPVDGISIGIPAVKSFDFKNLEEIKTSLPDMNPLSQEGYVVIDSNFNRIKIKSPKYVALHHVKSSGGGLRQLTEIVVNGEVDEFLSYFPEYSSKCLEIKNKWEILIFELETKYEEIKGIPVQKNFAFKATKTRCPSALFLLRAKKVDSIINGLRKLHLDSIIELLKD